MIKDLWNGDLLTQGDRNFTCAYAYDLNGNVTHLKRHGVNFYNTAMPTHIRSFGVIDDLAMTYSGNQLKSVTDRAEELTYAGAMDFKDGADKIDEYAYDANGNMTRDLNKGISRITYNPLNQPERILFADGHEVRYTYTADGRKLRAEYLLSNIAIIDADKATSGDVGTLALNDVITAPGIGELPAEPAVTTLMVRDYCGEHIYLNGKLERTLSPNGYIQDNDLYFYIKDYQGNVRAVLNQQNQVVELTAYYPYGAPMAATAAENVQPYKYGTKELDRENGLNWYDSRARFYAPLTGRTPTQDPMAEKYPHLSPYLWCAANPIRLIDKNGMNYGDTLATQDAAAIDFGLCYNGISIMVNAEYITNIYSFLSPKGTSVFSYTKPQLGSADKSVQPLEPTKGEKTVARAHTHAAFDNKYKNNNFSGATNSAEGNKHSSGGDLFVYNIEEVNGYVATPNGSLLRYDYDTGAIKTISTKLPSDSKDPTRLNHIHPLTSILIQIISALKH